MSYYIAFNKEDWHRVAQEDVPVYLHTTEPDWFVPNQAGDTLIQSLAPGAHRNGDLRAVPFLKRLPASRPSHYRGRAANLKLEYVRELWFHLTNQCNLACAHCLFSSSPRDTDELSGDRVLGLAAEAHELGCRVFALTGGEPFVHPEITRIITGLLALDGAHVVVLTNGMTLPHVLDVSRLDRDRFHLQISVDGMADGHDGIRGKGKFQSLTQNLHWLREQGLPFTLSMCVTRENVGDMPAIVDHAAAVGAGNVHFMWYFIRGRGGKERFAPVGTILKNLRTAVERAGAHHIQIDNIASLKTQIFAPRGTLHDGTTAAWESLAVGPDGMLYPSAALIGLPELASDLSGGLEAAWRRSQVLEKIRKATAASLDSPFRFLTGGGDLDHSYIHAGTYLGDDPYQPLYEQLALSLIAGEAVRQPDAGSPGLRLRMGEVLESCGAHGKVALLHSNCLLATAREDSLTIVKSYYAEAVGDKKTEILNPACYDEDLMAHIPEAYRLRGYGCGSPVQDARIEAGEDVLDLGCGSGVECFIAARMAGPGGRVTGIDMLDPMLALARKGRRGVTKNLGYANIEFLKGYLEHLPLGDGAVDVVVSNCVMNLSVHKRRSYGEIFRVLRPGGRLVISDVVCETEPDPAIRNDEVLRGECIAGAMTQGHLMALLTETGFTGLQLIKRFPYREVQGHPFFSLTYSAVKPKTAQTVRAIYRGPMPGLLAPSGEFLPQGEVCTLSGHIAELLGDQVFILDEAGTVTNVAAENTCACYISPEENKKEENETSQAEKPSLPAVLPRLSFGCMVCGRPITYLSEDRLCECTYCQKTFSTNTVCEGGHFVCDACHGADAMKVIENICMNTTEKDMVRLLARIRRHPAMPAHGPEHHALVPGIVLAAYRNSGGDIPVSLIQSGIQRGKSVAGGYCAFMGVCGAAVGVGIAFSLILDANPLTPGRRMQVQGVTQSVLADISSLKAARCCQRDSWLALKKAAELSTASLPVPLRADAELTCSQKQKNKECLGRACPLF